MRRLLTIMIISAAATAAAAGPVAAADEGAPPPVPQATSWFVLAPGPGEILTASRANERLPMASTTKIMTAVLVLESGRLDETAVVPASAAVGGSTGGLVAGESLGVRDLLTALLVGSGNDAAITLAEHLAGSQTAFVARMNVRAAELGLRNTRFANPHGLDAPGHYSTTRDLVRLGRFAMRRPLFRELVAQRTAIIPGPDGSGVRRLVSKNSLLELEASADGIKTGFTSGAGRAIVARATRPGVGSIYLALIGSPSEDRRARDADRLIDWSFSQYGRSRLLTPADVVVRARVTGRPGTTVGLTPNRPLGAAVRLGVTPREFIRAPARLTGPLPAGSAVGEIELRQGDRLIGRRALVTDREIPGPSFWSRVRGLFG